jgi:serine/threonine protein kinase
MLGSTSSNQINVEETPAKPSKSTSAISLSPSETPEISKVSNNTGSDDGANTLMSPLPISVNAVGASSPSTTTLTDVNLATPSSKMDSTSSSSDSSGRSSPVPLTSVSSKHFKKIRLLGKGDVGKVFLVQAQGVPQLKGLFAMKVYKKSDVVERKKVQRVILEHEILEQTSHPYLVSMYASFQTPSRLYVVMQYCQGGEFFRFLRKQPNKRICEEWARFYAAEVLCALEYLHFFGYIYRDLKGENILMHQSGHLILADFDLSKHQVHEFGSSEKKPSMVTLEKSSSFDNSTHTDATGVANFGEVGGASVVHDQRSGKNVVLFDRKTGKVSGSSRRKRGFGCGGCCGGGRDAVEVPVIDTEAHLNVDVFGDQLAQSFVGTFEYIAPEIIEYGGYAGSVDWWAFGILLYEMLFGVTPFKGVDNEDTLANTYNGDFKYPNNIEKSAEVKDLLDQLLAHDVKDRLASPNSIRQHAFFQSVNWPLLRHTEPPYIPTIEHTLDTRNFRQFDAFVDSDEDYDDNSDDEKKSEESPVIENKEGTKSQTSTPDQEKDINPEEEPDMITPSHMKVDLSFKAFGYIDQLGERHWKVDSVPTIYGKMKHVRKDCVESPASKARRASQEKK